MARGDRISFAHSELVTAAPAQVLAAFFDSTALAAWWQTIRSVTTPQPLGVYAVEWEPTAVRDEVLGPLGGAFHGTVMEYRAAREFFVADAYWLPPEGAPLGPMALEVRCRVEGPATRVHVQQSGREDGARWHRFYGIISAGWVSSLRALKTYIEGGQARSATSFLPAIDARVKKPMAQIRTLRQVARQSSRLRNQS